MAKRLTPMQLRAAVIERERKLLAATLKRVCRGAKSRRPDFPDLSCGVVGLAPLSNVAGVRGANLAKRSKEAAVPDGFFIGHSHKQGTMIMAKSELEWGGGKKS